MAFWASQVVQSSSLVQRSDTTSFSLLSDQTPPLSPFSAVRNHLFLPSPNQLKMGWATELLPALMHASLNGRIPSVAGRIEATEVWQSERGQKKLQHSVKLCHLVYIKIPTSILVCISVQWLGMAMMRQTFVPGCMYKT